MNQQTWISLLNQVGIEQLVGIAVGSTLLCLCGQTLLWAARRRSASVQSRLWQATGSAIVLTAVVLFAVPGIPLRTESSFSVVDQAITVAPTLGEVQLSPRSPMPSPPAATEFSEFAATLKPVATDDRATPLGVQDGREAMAATPLKSEIENSEIMTSSWIDRLPAILAAVWIAGLLCLLIGCVISVMRYRSIIATAVRDAPTDVANTAMSVCQRLNIPKCPRLLIAEPLPVPFTAGLFRPVIVLPAGAAEWSKDKLSMVLAHELAHVERRDVLWHWIGRLAVCVAWFNPLVWLAAKRGFLDRERACDDRVIGVGFAETDYGQCLLEVAAALSGRRIQTSAAISMAEPPVKQRLQWILSPTADRRRESVRLRRALLAAFCGLAVVLGTIRPLATAPAVVAQMPTQQTKPDVENRSETRQEFPQPANNDAEKPNNAPDEQISQQDADDELIELTKPVTGIITDENGKPIEGVRVAVKLKDFGGGSLLATRVITIESWQATTDGTGRYIVDISNVGKQSVRYEIGVEAADKPGFIQGRTEYWSSLKDVAAGKEIRTIKLSRGRRVTGKLLAANGEPNSAIVRAFARTQSGEFWSSSGLKVDDAGTLEIELPIGSQADLEVYPNDHSPMFVSVSPNQTDLGKIQLSRGSIVTGTVIDRNGNPLEGVVAVLDSTSYPLQGQITCWSRVAVTDEEGTFRLLPATGNCRLHVQESVQRQDRIGGNESVSGIRPPLIMPVTLSLSAEREKRQIVLKEPESYRISGTARWDDGEPASNFELVGGIAVGGPGPGITLATVATDANGYYELLLPKDSVAYVSGAAGAFRDGDREVWYKARGPSSTGSSTSISFEKLTSDMKDVNWELAPYRAAPSRTKAEIEAEKHFGELFGHARDPRELSLAKALAFEEKYRGHKEAVEAITRVLENPNSEPQALEEAVERLVDHYIGHEDLAETFGSLLAGPYRMEIPRAEFLLRVAAARSPHPTVRAEALFIRAKHAKAQLKDLKRLPALQARFVMQSMRSISDTWDTSPESIQRSADFQRQSNQLLQQQLAALKAIDPEELRSNAVRWLQTIEKDYADLLRPRAMGHTFGQDAKALRFAIEHVNMGQAAPPYEATDINGKIFRLPEHLGKVVVISFNQSVPNKADNLPHQALADQFPDESVQLVTIVATDSQENFLPNANAANLKGTVIWEPLRGPHQSNWGVTGFPTTFIVDQTGNLRGISTQPAATADLVTELLKEDVRDQARNQINSPHPVVRATALLTQAEQANVQIRDLTELEKIDARRVVLKDSLEDGGNLVTNRLETMTAMTRLRRERLRNLKSRVEQKTQAIRWLEIIDKQYAELPRPDAAGHTFGQDAEVLRFAIQSFDVVNF